MEILYLYPVFVRIIVGPISYPILTKKKCVDCVDTDIAISEYNLVHYFLLFFPAHIALSKFRKYHFILLILFYMITKTFPKKTSTGEHTSVSIHSISHFLSFSNHCRKSYMLLLTSVRLVSAARRQVGFDVHWPAHFWLL